MSLLDQIVSEFDIIARELRDHVYPAESTDADDQCLYVRETGESSLESACIIGYWLHRFHRVPLAAMHEHEGCNAGELIRSLLRLGRLPAVWWEQLGTREFAFLHTVQKQQDNGAPWGEAVYRAKAADVALQSA